MTNKESAMCRCMYQHNLYLNVPSYTYSYTRPNIEQIAQSIFQHFIYFICFHTMKAHVDRKPTLVFADLFPTSFGVVPHLRNTEHMGKRTIWHIRLETTSIQKPLTSNIRCVGSNYREFSSDLEYLKYEYKLSHTGDQMDNITNDTINPLVKCIS